MPSPITDAALLDLISAAVRLRAAQPQVASLAKQSDCADLWATVERLEGERDEWKHRAGILKAELDEARVSYSESFKQQRLAERNYRDLLAKAEELEKERDALKGRTEELERQLLNYRSGVSGGTSGTVFGGGTLAGTLSPSRDGGGG